LSNLVLNRFELNQYAILKQQLIGLEESIREVNDELAELNQYNINVSPVYTGMPMGNEKRDKIAEYVIKLENERNRLSLALVTLIEERNAIKLRLRMIRAAVNKIPGKQLRDLIRWHFFDELSIPDVADKGHITVTAVYKKMERFFIEDAMKK